MNVRFGLYLETRFVTFRDNNYQFTILLHLLAPIIISRMLSIRRINEWRYECGARPTMLHDGSWKRD